MNDKVNKKQHQAKTTGGATKQPPKTTIKKAPSAKKSKANALRSKKRAAARKARKVKLLALLHRYDRALKERRPKLSEKLLGHFKLLKVAKTDIAQMRDLSSALTKAENAVAKQRENLSAMQNKKGSANSGGITSAEKKLNDATTQLKRAQKAEQEFFLAITRAQAKNASCPFCSVDRISVDSHVMDVHPPRWGEYLTLLEKI